MPIPHRALGLLLLLACSLSTPRSAPAQVVTAPAVAVPLSLPSSIAFDAAGNLYLAETNHHLIREVDAAGNLRTVAGNGIQGFSGDGGPATAAELDSPRGLAVDPAGNLFLSDTRNHRIRRVDAATGIITTIAGTGAPGFSGDSGPATAARLNTPAALALDAQNNLFVADRNNHRVREISSATGVISTVAGNGLQGFSGDNGPATAAELDSPDGLALDAAGRLYLADTHNQRIRVVDPATHLIRTLAGSGTLGASGDLSAATAARLAMPRGLSLDPSGNLYFADTQNHRIRRIDAVTGILSTVAGLGTQNFAGDAAPAIAASLNSPVSTAISPTGLVTVADTGNQRIRQLTAPAAPATTIVTLAGLGATIPGLFSLSAPAVLAYGSGSLTASLLSSTPATGSVNFLETTSAGTSLLGAANLSANAATLSLAALPAGPHRISATYSGDATHPSSQTTAVSVSVSPLPVTLTPLSATMSYGQTPPALTGSATGILPQDLDGITAVFATAATSRSPVGTYPVAATLTGPRAGNYLPTTAPASLVITRSPATILLTSTLLATTTGTATLSAQVSPTTSGAPTGTVTFLDAQQPFAAAPITSGLATWTAANLLSGQHSFTAVYSGDFNFTPAVSSASLLVLPTAAGATPAPDFTLTPTGVTSQTIATGGSATFTFTVQVQGSSLSSPVTLSATGLPNLAVASFNPNFLPPGSTSSTFFLTVATPKSNTAARGPAPNLPVLLTLTLPLALLRRKRDLLPALTLAAALFLCGCGDRINAGLNPNGSIQAYTITIVGTAVAPDGSPLQHTAALTLNVQK